MPQCVYQYVTILKSQEKLAKNFTSNHKRHLAKMQYSDLTDFRFKDRKMFRILFKLPYNAFGLDF